jgi:hypothetical protein
MTIQRGEIYFVDLDPVKGRKPSGLRHLKKKERSCHKSRCRKNA